MQLVTPLSRDDVDFYKSTLYQLVQDSSVGTRPGADMMRTLRKEFIRSSEHSEFAEYNNVVGEFYKLVTDSLVSAVHRATPHELVNRSLTDFHIVTDEEEYQFHHDDGFFDADDEEDMETDTNSDLGSVARDPDPKQRRREELKKKRREEEDMLLREKKVMDEKGRPYSTLGPFPAPRLTVRAPTNTFPSRKALQHRTIIETPSPSSSDADEADDKVAEGDKDDLGGVATSRHADARGGLDGGGETGKLQPGGSGEGGEAVNHLTDFIRPLSVDSLKKMSESAKAKLRPSSSHDEFVSQIVKTAVRLGCEKACVLMDKQKIMEDMSTPVQTGPLPTTASIDVLNTLPDNLKQSLGNVLGLPHEKPPVEEMWERMVAMGFLSVLTNLRLKPLKKIASELSIALPDTNSTEKFCEAIVFAAFPRERIRAKVSRSKLKKVRFTIPPESMYTKGDMGFISFQVSNISMLTKESERHYSPEFSFAQLKWSLLCMTNKESLALYLCQVGSVHCKFLITVVNHANSDDSICNEGTQSFSALSQENDWGFNNVIRFSDLLNPAQGFLDTNNDSITIEVGIVLVEPLKSVAREKAAPVKERKAAPKVDEAAVRRLLEDERAENMRKKIRQEMTKTVKEEERTRRELASRATRTLHDLLDRLKQETKRVAKELADRERREEQERQRELEKIRQAQQQTAEMKRRVVDIREENETLLQEKQRCVKESKEMKKACEKLTLELKALQEKIQTAQAKVKAQEKRIEAAKRRYDAIAEQEPPTPTSSDDENDLMNADLGRLIDEMTVGM